MSKHSTPHKDPRKTIDKRVKEGRWEEEEEEEEGEEEKEGEEGKGRGRRRREMKGDLAEEEEEKN